MMKFKAVLLSALLLGVGGSAMAAGAGYAGIGVGNSDFTIDGDSETFEDTNIRAYMGYQLNRYFAIETGLNSIPLDDFLGDIGDLTGMDVSLIASLPITSRFSAHARLGYWDWETDAPYTYNGTYYSGVGGSDMIYGIGMEYKLSSQFKLRVDATHYDASDAELQTLNGSIAYSW